MVSIARKNLFYDRTRFIVAQAGIMFAVGLVTIQIGILNGFTKSTRNLIDQSKADLWIAHEDMRYLDLTLPIPYKWLETVQQIEGVDRAEAIISSISLWRYTRSELAAVRIVGIDPTSQLLNLAPLASGEIKALQDPYTITIDTLDQVSLDVSGLGQTTDIGSFQAKVVGFTSGIKSIVTSPLVFTSLTNANAFINSPLTPPAKNPPQPAPLTPRSPITYILIKAKAGIPLSVLQHRLQEKLPGSRIVTQAQLAKITQDYWRNSTGIGYIFGLGAAVGVIVGTVVVGQILYSSVSAHIQEYGTLKAMGSSDGFLYRVILEQAIWMALLGYIPGMALSLAVGTLSLNTQAVQILISPMTAGIVLVVTVAMCSGAAIFSIQKVTRLDPAIVFKS